MTELASISPQKQDLYKNCYELPLYWFIEAVCEGDTNRIENWDEVYSEYAMLSNDPKQVRLLNILKDISVLSNKITLIEGIAQQLSRKFNQELADILKSYGFPIKESPTYQNDLQMIITRAKSMVIRKNDRLKDLENMNSGAGERPKKSDFDNLLVELSKFMTFRIDSKVVTVSEFCAILNKYKQSIAKK